MTEAQRKSSVSIYFNENMKSKIIKIWLVLTVLAIGLTAFFNEHNLYQTEAMIFAFICSCLISVITLLIVWFWSRNK